MKKMKKMKSNFIVGILVFMILAGSAGQAAAAHIYKVAVLEKYQGKSSTGYVGNMGQYGYDGYISGIAYSGSVKICLQYYDNASGSVIEFPGSRYYLGTSSSTKEHYWNISGNAERVRGHIQSDGFFTADSGRVSIRIPY